MVAATAALGLGGCGTGGSDRSGGSVLEPASSAAEEVADLGWVMFIAAAVVSAGVFALLAWGLVRRRRSAEESDRRAERWIIAGGVVLPVVVLTPVAALGIAALDEPAESAVRVEVVAHQYWWEYRYLDSGFTTANELHIPVDQPVELTLRSDDVIHSLWVPELGGKTDLIPGHTNTMTLEARRPGTYQGKCAEYCGLQHAKMLFLVIAEPEGDFEAWVADQRRAAETPTTSRGAALFRQKSCAACHTVRGTEADGRLGPDLTHVASRRTLAAGVLENTPENLRRWIGETWEVKHGITMPPVPLTEQEVDAIAEYLEELE